jgi:hypothetical protein
MPARGQATQPAAPVRLLRYRFDSVDQVSRHFHVAGGRVVMFYPCLLPLRPGEPVLLYVTFMNSEQHCRLAGVVIGRDAGGQYAGAWLEFAAYGIVAGLQSATTPKRLQRRFPTDTVINLERPDGLRVVAKLIDVGLGGGRMSGTSVRVTPGDNVRLSLFSRDTGTPVIGARVAWARPQEIGIEFNSPFPAERAAIAALTAEARQNLANAYEATHPTFCRCKTDTVAEPPLPRPPHRQTASR